MVKKINDKLLDEVGKAYLTQNHQTNKATDRVVELEKDLSSLSEINDNNLDDLDQLLDQAKNLINNSCIGTEEDAKLDYLAGEDLVKEYSAKNTRKMESVIIPTYEELDTIEVNKDISWDKYLDNISTYADKNGIDLSKDPFDELLSSEDKRIIADRIKKDYTMGKANCDKYDYMIASFCGVIAGLIDSFFVGMPKKSKLGNWTNKQTDQMVIKIAKLCGHKNKNITIENSIRFFEKYKVNYDQAVGKSAGDLLGMSMSNHHIKSLGHAPDLIGLLFSIIDQFSRTSHFLDNGRLITFDTQEFTLHGNNFVAKLFCGISNWIGHLISDVAGSSTTRKKKDSKGSGIPMPLFELFQLCNKGSFKVYANKAEGIKEMTLADLSVKVFEEGYDARFAMAQAIPVGINEISIRLLWSLKARFYANKPWKECIPFGNNPELRRMLLTGHGVLCMVDGVDAVARSNNDILSFALHLNFQAWKRLAFSGLMEVRAIYKENTLDLNVLEKDLESEWDEIFKSSDIKI